MSIAVAAIFTFSGIVGAKESDNFGYESKKMKLKPCPNKPNCVSSQSEKGPHFVEPIRYQSSGSEAFNTLKQIVKDMAGTRIIQSTEKYFHAEFQTKWLKFVDDFEALLYEDSNLIHIRSASRIGYWDLGKNKARVDEIKIRFHERRNKVDRSL